MDYFILKGVTFTNFISLGHSCSISYILLYKVKIAFGGKLHLYTVTHYAENLFPSFGS